MSSFQKMPKVPSKKMVVQTPGSYRVPPPTPKTTPVRDGDGQLHKINKRGRPMLKKARKPRKQLRERAAYTEEDMVEAVRLVKEEEYCVKRAALHTNARKRNAVPRPVLIKTDMVRRYGTVCTVISCSRYPYLGIGIGIVQFFTN